ncbi:MAG: hypothetical protein H8E14_02760 [Candidatus Marinimicrobia bacterium]|nr:hypothetical protein [Candidatus Neomarinimicrobiota bacterium]
MIEAYLKKIIERIKPDISYVKQPIKGKVIAVQPDTYTCDVQPETESHPVIPSVEILTVWATPTTRLLALPQVDSIVIVGFLNGDNTKPYIQGFITETGFSNRFIIESETSRIFLDDDGMITVESDTKVNVNAPEIFLGESAAEAIIKGNTFQSIFNAHTHSTGVGPSTPPVQPLNGTELSEVVKCA